MENFLAIDTEQTYTLFGSDVDDNIIRNEASLKTAIVRNLIQRRTRSVCSGFRLNVPDYLISDPEKSLFFDDLIVLLQMGVDLKYHKQHS